MWKEFKRQILAKSKKRKKRKRIIVVDKNPMISKNLKDYKEVGEAWGKFVRDMYDD